ncbi:hypothetical protein J1P26_20060 [Neobacillus sp. MM2021_6]|uniref:hypothetical protein n=1 Tax=Bacillaceae TaxID=186817 RepID=UPI00140D1E24|nr:MULTISPECIES: hypothetical protein [Bacillaceae]MBO0962004.1 hypothetical protein [Neobacillus sp. MM2021_6]NHC20301.1 hypothetical protein [Bacillus sp. MM2020_4]
MDYKAFYTEVAEWIMQANQMAVKNGLDSDAFWNWVTSSMGEMSKRYNNNQLVIKQMAMLYEWLDEVYAKGRNKQNG